MALFKKKKDIDKLAEKGNALFDNGRYNEAIAVWREGLDTLDKPLNLQSEAVWFLTSIADAYFSQGNFENAYAYLFEAISNVSGEGYTNPFVMLRLGQCAYELNKENAKEYLLRAYMLAGEEIFESDDEKYFEFIKDMI